MAIRKELTDNRGQKTSYHRIVAMTAVYIPGQESIQVNLASYTDAQYRELEKQSTSGEGYAVSSTAVVLPLPTDDIVSRALTYTQIMSLPEWQDSEAC